MVFAHINKIQHGPTRKATKIALRAHLILLKLIALKTILFSFVGVKAFVMESAFLMAIMGWIPHVQTTFAQVLPSVNYSISNTTFPLITEDGEVVIYMYYMQNDQQPYTPGSNVEVSANIPEGMSYDGASIEPSSITETTVTWTIPDNDNRYKMILLRLMVEPETKGSVTNTVTVTAANPDPNTSNNSASASVVVGNDGNLQGDVDLYLTKTVDMTQANITDEITYTIDFGNMGADTAIGTIIYDLIPDDIYIISADPLPTHINNNGIYQRTIGDLPGGQGGQITIRAALHPLLSSGFTIYNHAVIDSEVYEEDFDDNVSTAETIIQDGSASMWTQIYATGSNYCSGDIIPFTITFGNQGSLEASNVSIRNIIPTQLEYMYGSVPYTHNIVNQYTWDIDGDIYPGDQGSFVVTTRAESVGAGIANIVVVDEDDQIVASGSYEFNIVPDDACDYFNPGSGTGTTNTTGGTTTTTGGNTTVTPPPTTTTGPVIPPPTPTPTGNILPTGFILPPLPTGTVSTGSTGNLFSGINLTGLVTTGTTKITGTNITTGSVFQLRETLVTVQPVATSPWDPTKSTATTKTTTLSGKPVDTSKPVYTALDVQAKALVNNINKPRTCDDTMVEAYKYAKSKDLISAKSVEDAGLCQPLERRYFAQIMVKFAMSQAIIEPNLMKKCNFKDLKGASNEEQFYIALACDFGLVGQNDNFRPFEMTKRKEAALALARFAFGTEFIKAETNQFNEAMRLLYDAYVMKNITDADANITKGQLIMMLQRVDYGEVLNNSRYIRLLEQEKNQ